MLFRAYCILFRRRLLAAAFVALFAPALSVLVVAHLCACDTNTVTNDLKLPLAFLSIVVQLLGIIFGVGVASQAPGMPSEARFLLTRPIPRLVMQFYPLVIATAAIVLLPMLGWAVVLGVLRLARAPMLARLTSVVFVYPQIQLLGPHPSLAAILGAMQTGRRYLAAVSVGVAIFTLFAALRWCAASTNKRLRLIGNLGVFLPVLSATFLWRSSLSQAILLLQTRHGSPDYLPSNMGIALHFVFAAACICAQFVVMRDIEI